MFDNNTSADSMFRYCFERRHRDYIYRWYAKYYLKLLKMTKGRYAN